MDIPFVKNIKPVACAALILAGPSAQGAAVAFYTDSTDVSGFGPMATANANSWGGSDKTTGSVIFEVTFDYTEIVANATDPFALFELGADAIGSGIAFQGNNIIFAAGGGSVANTGVATGPHGLAAGQTGVQVVAAFEREGGTGTNELLSLYVNGFLVATSDNATNGDWAGANTSNLGLSDAFSIFEYVPSLNPGGLNNQLFATAFPDQDTNVTFAAYDPSVTDNTLENILVPIPEPGSLALLSLAGLTLLRRRSRA